MFSYVKCRRCGRMLRARRSPKPTTIQCWECQAEVKVPRHRSAEISRRTEPYRGAMRAELVEVGAVAVLLGLAVTFVITVPYAGPWLGLAVLIGAALLYLRRIEEVPTPGVVLEPDRAEGGLKARAGRRAGRLALAAALAVGLVGPARLFDGSAQLSYRPPLLPPPLPLAALLLAWIAVPLAAFALVARDEHGRLGPRRALAVARERRWSTLLALLLPIAALAATEAATLGILARNDRLRSFVLDVTPPAKALTLKDGLAFVDGVFTFLDPPEALRYYAQGLARGATLVGSVPLSFRRGLAPRINTAANSEFKTEEFLLSRLGISAAVMIVALGALAAQAGWLGRIGGSAPPPEGEDEGEDEDEGDVTSDASPGEAPGGPLALPPSGPGPGVDRPGPGRPP